nr:MAG TPA: hypothetical protein [Caudoviricetes sp.]
MAPLALRYPGFAVRDIPLRPGPHRPRGAREGRALRISEGTHAGRR